jgi:hypothetical protein
MSGKKKVKTEKPAVIVAETTDDGWRVKGASGAYIYFNKGNRFESKSDVIKFFDNDFDIVTKVGKESGNTYYQPVMPLVEFEDKGSKANILEDFADYEGARGF